ncbi:MAG: hypothetical protein QXM37_02575 [Candidatus Bathyarchaeia archaeon]
MSILEISLEWGSDVRGYRVFAPANAKVSYNKYGKNAPVIFEFLQPEPELFSTLTSLVMNSSKTIILSEELA